MSISLSAQPALTPFNGENAKLGFTGASLVNAIPGPAVMVWADGRVISANKNASDIVVGHADHGLVLRSDLLPQVQKIATTQTSENWVIRMRKRGQPDLAAMSYSLTGISIPVEGGKSPAVLIYGADSALERNLRQALIESRIFYQDLANCSSDFTWSTDMRGVFTFINQKGVAGHQADIMHGKPALDLVAQRTPRDQVDAVFQTREVVNEKEIWLKGAEGDDYCFMISALPVHAADGKWTGARGVGRDVTELREREDELRRARRSEKLINTVLGIIRSEVDPSKMLATAAAAVIDAIGMTSCWMFKRKYSEEFSSETAHILNIVPRASLGIENAPASADMRAIVTENLKNSEANVAIFTKKGWSFLVAKTKYSGQVNGTLCFVRQIDSVKKNAQSKPIWDAYEHSMISCVADQLSVVVAQSEYQEELKVLSQTDGLTGLMNRRSFLPETSRRLAHHERKKRKAAFLFIDLDNFKGINDTDGHAQGDQILKAISELIKMNCRSSDLSARFGGDEFAIWLEEADVSIAILKANDLIDGCQDIIAIAQKEGGISSPSSSSIGLSVAHLGMSIGISVFEPGTSETLEQLIARADDALYVAKRGGKGGYRIAEALSPTTSEQGPGGARGSNNE